MIAIIRSASIAPGKMGNATAFGHQIAKSIKTKHGTTLEVLMPIGGNPGRIAWLARYDSVARWEALTGKLIADKEYMNLIQSKPNQCCLDRSMTIFGGRSELMWRRILLIRSWRARA